MNNEKRNRTIKEHDLFNYVFFPDSVKSETKEQIETDPTFNQLIEFYKKLKLNSSIKPDEELKKKIASKIPEYRLSTSIPLYPLNNPITKKNGLRLAANSIDLNPKLTTKTFVDNDNEYLIKVLNCGDFSKVFVFSTRNEVVKNFDIVIEPHNLKFHFNDNSVPLKIDQSIVVEKIEIRFI